VPARYACRAVLPIYVYHARFVTVGRWNAVPRFSVTRYATVCLLWLRLHVFYVTDTTPRSHLLVPHFADSADHVTLPPPPPAYGSYVPVWSHAHTLPVPGSFTYHQFGFWFLAVTYHTPGSPPDCTHVATGMIQVHGSHLPRYAVVPVDSAAFIPFPLPPFITRTTFTVPTFTHHTTILHTADLLCQFTYDLIPAVGFRLLRLPISYTRTLPSRSTRCCYTTFLCRLPYIRAYRLPLPRYHTPVRPYILHITFCGLFPFGYIPRVCLPRSSTRVDSRIRLPLCPAGCRTVGTTA